MRVDTYAICYNEEKILPYFLRHYLQYGYVYLFDNFSTDNSVKLAQQAGAKVEAYDSGGELRDDIYIKIKNNCWKGSTADWVIVVDTDEFVYCPTLLDILKDTKFTAFEPTWFEMFSQDFPTTNGQIYDEVKMGYEAWPKLNIFRPSEVKELNYEIGCHLVHPEGNIILNYAKSPIRTLHMRHLGKQYIIDRNAGYAKRMSELNKKNGWGWHLTQTTEQICVGFDKEFAITRQVI
jgi:glycosyltransferase involved in cell wall biosynthesis